MSKDGKKLTKLLKFLGDGDWHESRTISAEKISYETCTLAMLRGLVELKSPHRFLEMWRITEFGKAALEVSRGTK